MAPHLIATLAFVGATLVACDVSQKRPETGSSMRSSAVVRDLQGLMELEAISPVDAEQSSVRLLGPGIHPQRQTRT